MGSFTEEKMKWHGMYRNQYRARTWVPRFTEENEVARHVSKSIQNTLKADKEKVPALSRTHEG